MGAGTVRDWAWALGTGLGRRGDGRRSAGTSPTGDEGSRTAETEGAMGPAMRPGSSVVGPRTRRHTASSTAAESRQSGAAGWIAGGGRRTGIGVYCGPRGDGRGAAETARRRDRGRPAAWPASRPGRRSRGSKVCSAARRRRRQGRRWREPRRRRPARSLPGDRVGGGGLRGGEGRSASLGRSPSTPDAPGDVASVSSGTARCGVIPSAARRRRGDISDHHHATTGRAG